MSAKQTIISGGSSESDVTALAVIPLGPSGPSDVTTQTPVAKRPQASRNSSGSIWPAMARNLSAAGREKPSGADPFAAVMCERASRIVEAAPEADKLSEPAPPDRRRTSL